MSLIRTKLIAYLLPCVLVAACSPGGASDTGGRTLHGAVDLTMMGFTEATIGMAVDCSKLAPFKVNIANGKGEILAVGTTKLPVQKPGSDIKPPGAECYGEYTVTVPESNVYTLSLQGDSTMSPVTVNAADIKDGQVPPLTEVS